MCMGALQVVHNVYVVPVGDRRGCQTPCSRVTMWLVKIKLGPPGRAVSALSQGALSPAS